MTGKYIDGCKKLISKQSRISMLHHNDKTGYFMTYSIFLKRILHTNIYFGFETFLGVLLVVDHKLHHIGCLKVFLCLIQTVSNSSSVHRHKVTRMKTTERQVRVTSNPEHRLLESPPLLDSNHLTLKSRLTLTTFGTESLRYRFWN